jgi:adenosine kinase
MAPEYFQDSDMAVLCVAYPDDVVLFLENVKRYGTPLAFSMRADTKVFPPPLLKEILLEAKIIFTNEEEKVFIERLFGFGDICDLMSQGKAETIITTLGPSGSVVHGLGPNGVVAHIAVPAIRPDKVVDATGAGDAYVAGFLYGYSAGKDLKTCAEYGGATASFILEKDGCLTNVPARAAMLRRYAERGEK